MNKYIWLAVGFILGSAVTYYVVKDEFERISDEEIESVREMYLTMSASKQQAKNNEEQKDAYKKMIDKSGYNYGTPIEAVDDVREDVVEKHKNAEKVAELVHHNLFKDIDNQQKATEAQQKSTETQQRNNRVYTITPEEFVHDKKDYDKITLEYYDDGFLVEEISGDVVTDISSAVGYESLNKFGEYEEDVVYVRNDQFETDYEVIRQHCDYSSS